MFFIQKKKYNHVNHNDPNDVSAVLYAESVLEAARLTTTTRVYCLGWHEIDRPVWGATCGYVCEIV